MAAPTTRQGVLDLDALMPSARHQHRWSPWSVDRFEGPATRRCESCGAAQERVASPEEHNRYLDRVFADEEQG